MESTQRNVVISSPNHGSRRLQDGILRHLSEWNGLQMAVQNQWGGRDSHQKSLQLATDIFSWFAHSKGCLRHSIHLLHLHIYIYLVDLDVLLFSCSLFLTARLCVEDLENLLHDSLLLSFNTDIEDGSIEQVRACLLS